MALKIFMKIGVNVMPLASIPKVCFFMPYTQKVTWRMLNFMNRDDENINHDKLHMRITNPTQPNTTQPNPT
jgi:hypothetical protein